MIKKVVANGILIVVTVAVLVSIPLHRINATGYQEGTLTLTQRIVCGYTFPKETPLPDSYRFKNGDILVMYRPSCPDCQKYIVKIRWLLRSKDAIYLCDRTESGMKHYDPAWVPSIIFFSDNDEAVFEIRTDEDLQEVERFLGETS